MAKITYITQNEEKITLEATSGSLMQLAKDYGVDGIDGECGGVCSCATCHVHVEEGPVDKIADQSEFEADLLELNDYANEKSRLCCQIPISEELDGLVVRVADRD